MPAPIYRPPYPPIEVVRNATLEARKAMLAEWDAEFVRMNPEYFHSDGTQRSFLNWLIGTRR